MVEVNRPDDGDIHDHNHDDDGPSLMVMIYRWWRYVATHLLPPRAPRALDQYLLHRLPDARALIQTLLPSRALF